MQFSVNVPHISEMISQFFKGSSEHISTWVKSAPVQQTIKSITDEFNKWTKNDRTEQALKIARVAIGVLSLSAAGACAACCLMTSSLQFAVATAGCAMIALVSIPSKLSATTISHLVADIFNFCLRSLPKKAEQPAKEQEMNVFPTHPDTPAAFYGTTILTPTQADVTQQDQRIVLAS